MKAKLKLKPQEWTAFNDVLWLIAGTRANELAGFVILEAVEKIAKRTVLTSGQPIKITFTPAQSCAMYFALANSRLTLDEYRAAIIASVLPLIGSQFKKESIISRMRKM